MNIFVHKMWLVIDRRIVYEFMNRKEIDRIRVLGSILRKHHRRKTRLELNNYQCFLQFRAEILMAADILKKCCDVVAAWQLLLHTVGVNFYQILPIFFLNRSKISEVTFLLQHTLYSIFFIKKIRLSVRYAQIMIL